TYEYSSYYKILPQLYNWNKDSKRIKKGKLVPKNFVYDSNNNLDWMTKSTFKKWLKLNQNFIGKF